MDPGERGPSGHAPRLRIVQLHWGAAMLRWRDTTLAATPPRARGPGISSLAEKRTHNQTHHVLRGGGSAQPPRRQYDLGGAVRRRTADLAARISTRIRRQQTHVHATACPLKHIAGSFARRGARRRICFLSPQVVGAGILRSPLRIPLRRPPRRRVHIWRQSGLVPRTSD